LGNHRHQPPAAIQAVEAPAPAPEPEPLPTPFRRSHLVSTSVSHFRRAALVCSGQNLWKSPWARCCKPNSHAIERSFLQRQQNTHSLQTGPTEMAGLFLARQRQLPCPLGRSDLEFLRQSRWYSALLWRSIMAKKSKKASETGITSREPNLLTIAYAARLEREVNREVPSPRAVVSRKKPRTPHK
jgi:hypothetical protein